MGIDYAWNDVAFREATEEDEEKIQLALESEDALHGNGDWSVRLGINIYYSAILSRSPLYSKQMPYNTIIYKAFGRFSPSSTPTKLKFYGKTASSRQKRIKVAGKWCGKVWMSNQVHPLLIERDTEEVEEQEEEEPEEEEQQQEQEEEQQQEQEEEHEEQEEEEQEEEERSFYAWGRPEVKLETFANEIANGVTSSSSTRRSSRKRKHEEVEKAKTPKPSVVKKRAKGKKMKADVVIEEGGEYGCDMEGCTMSFGSKQELLLHERNICPVKECGKKFFSHKYLVQHRRVHDDDRPLRCPWKGCKMTFKWAWARTEHIRVHTGERPYVCTVTGCGQTFRFVSDFSRHKRKTGHTSKTGRS